MSPDPATDAALRRIGRRIAELRRARALTQEKVAEKIDMLTPNYARIEQGRQNVTVDTLLRIARALDAELEDFFAGHR